MGERYCPNPDCRHRRLTGSPAEYAAAVAACADCGWALQEAGPGAGAAPSPPRAPGAAHRPAPWRRLLVTAGLVAAAALMGLVPMPGLDRGVARTLAGGGDAPAWWLPVLSVAALSVVPYVSAWLMVEVGLAALQAIRRRLLRVAPGEPPSRASQGPVVLGVTVLVAALQGLGIAVYLEGTSRSLFFGELVPSPGTGFRVTLTATLVAGCLVHVALARTITRHGLGNGVAALLLLRLGGPIWAAAHAAVRGPGPAIERPELLLLFGAMLAAALWAVWRFERRHQVVQLLPQAPPAAATDGATTAPSAPYRIAARDPNPVHWRVKDNPAGIVPVGAALGVPLLLDAACGFRSALCPAVPDPAGPASVVLIGAAVAAAALVYVAFTASPRRLVLALARAGLEPSRGERPLSALRERQHLHGIVYCVALAVLPLLAARALPGAPTLSAVELVFLTAYALDLAAEWRFRRRTAASPPVPVRVEHDVAAAAFLRDWLEQKHGIDCHVQAYHQRALVGLLGPCFELVIWVPGSRAGEATAALDALSAPLT